ncbi:dihydrofolate reductase family protein [Planomonospora sp. ID67723]|uniref:dihydrofolate reductase family protein n=1 Tax=Planomonospora sp. ID67723 TaxID=2738134 RepID=UPI0018C3743E|nr:dihydrofolate reductase family protein [Planomonospora sp. ID67723]MBG0829240.1 dihydrofolate reductase family protein [Planomonospora sp. ID67723]
MRKLVYYIGVTIDGFIAAPDGSADFFPVTKDVVDFLVADYPDTLPTHVREQLGVHGDNPHFDTGVQGRVTYEPALEIGVTSPYAHLRQYVVSESMTASPDPAVEIVSGDPLAKVRELKAEEGKDIYLIGGARLAGTLLPEIDRLVVKLYPVVAGAGIPLFSAEFSPVHFELAGTRVLDGGTVVLTYDRK